MWILRSLVSSEFLRILYEQIRSNYVIKGIVNSIGRCHFTIYGHFSNAELSVGKYEHHKDVWMPIDVRYCIEENNLLIHSNVTVLSTSRRLVEQSDIYVKEWQKGRKGRSVAGEKNDHLSTRFMDMELTNRQTTIRRAKRHTVNSIAYNSHSNNK